MHLMLATFFCPPSNLPMMEHFPELQSTVTSIGEPDMLQAAAVCNNYAGVAGISSSKARWNSEMHGDIRAPSSNLSTGVQHLQTISALS